MSITSIFLACNNSDDNSPEVTGEKSTEFAPKSIVGKSFSKGSSGFKVYDFTSSGTCSITLISTGTATITITGTPTYTYTKQSANSAILSYSYNQKMVFLGKTTNSLEATDVILTFTTSTSGTFESKGYSNGSYLYKDSGIFTLQ